MFITCNAKINIGLEILNKRYDDYHNINTIFRKICLSDELIIEENSSFEFIFNSDTKFPKEQNIAFIAAQKFKELHRLGDLPVKITINKHIPTGAGLGGGSSDAAMTLTGLQNFFKFDKNNQELLEIASQLGADVPFFMSDSRTAHAKGRGDELTPVEFPMPWYLLLVLPEIHISTAEAYASLKRTDDEIPSTDYTAALNIITEKPEKMKEFFRNDFEDYAFNKYPELAQIKSTLYGSGAFFAQMSGTGSAVYGMFLSEKSAKQAIENFPQYRTHICPLY